jgi:hypothetical protein
LSIATRIKDCIDKHDEYVAILAAFSDKELIKKLELVHIQSEIAEQTKNTGSLQLLEVWRAQIIEARILKAENNVPDAPNEIELAIADIETTLAKAGKRQEIVEDIFTQPEKSRAKKNPDNQNQTSLF